MRDATAPAERDKSLRQEVINLFRGKTFEFDSLHVDNCRGGTPWPPALPGDALYENGRPQRAAPTVDTRKINCCSGFRLYRSNTRRCTESASSLRRLTLAQ